MKVVNIFQEVDSGGRLGSLYLIRPPPTPGSTPSGFPPPPPPCSSSSSCYLRTLAPTPARRRRTPTSGPRSTQRSLVGHGLLPLLLLLLLPLPLLLLLLRFLLLLLFLLQLLLLLLLLILLLLLLYSSGPNCAKENRMLYPILFILTQTSGIWSQEIRLSNERLVQLHREQQFGQQQLGIFIQRSFNYISYIS